MGAGDESPDEDKGEAEGEESVKKSLDKGEQAVAPKGGADVVPIPNPVLPNLNYTANPHLFPHTDAGFEFAKAFVRENADERVVVPLGIDASDDENLVPPMTAYSPRYERDVQIERISVDEKGQLLHAVVDGTPVGFRKDDLENYRRMSETTTGELAAVIMDEIHSGKKEALTHWANGELFPGHGDSILLYRFDDMAAALGVSDPPAAAEALKEFLDAAVDFDGIAGQQPSPGDEPPRLGVATDVYMSAACVIPVVDPSDLDPVFGPLISAEASEAIKELVGAEPVREESVPPSVLSGLRTRSVIRTGSEKYGPGGTYSKELLRLRGDDLRANAIGGVLPAMVESETRERVENKYKAEHQEQGLDEDVSERIIAASRELSTSDEFRKNKAFEVFSERAKFEAKFLSVLDGMYGLGVGAGGDYEMNLAAAAEAKRRIPGEVMQIDASDMPERDKIESRLDLVRAWVMYSFAERTSMLRLRPKKTKSDRGRWAGPNDLGQIAKEVLAQDWAESIVKMYSGRLLLPGEKAKKGKKPGAGNVQAVIKLFNQALGRVIAKLDEDGSTEALALATQLRIVKLAIVARFMKVG
jgi:hypothetical protein